MKNCSLKKATKKIIERLREIYGASSPHLMPFNRLRRRDRGVNRDKRENYKRRHNRHEQHK